MREIVFDTETTGTEPSEGDRVVEIGCLELFNHVPTGRTWHTYLNPERDVPAEAVAVHGLTAEFLRDKPVFSQVFDQFTEFIGDAAIVAHNAAFDVKFINAELALVGHKGLGSRAVVDTVDMARRKFPGSPASLDALCRRFGIDNSGRSLHGALLDAELLAEVYLQLIGGRQHDLGLAAIAGAAAVREQGQALLVSVQASRVRISRDPRPHLPSEEELTAHVAMLAELQKISGG